VLEPKWQIASAADAWVENSALSRPALREGSGAKDPKRTYN
jgi:hypothetical protein